jgi:hypothetical protein
VGGGVTPKELDALWMEFSERLYLAGGICDMGFIVKDSGERKEFASGMKRDVTEGKIDYTLVFDGPMLERLAVHLTKGAKKYDARNWMKAAGEEEMNRFRESAVRHFVQWMRGDTDEDHAAAVMFNINGYEYVRGRLREDKV